MGKKVRGSILSGFIKFVERTWGEDGRNDLIDETGVDVNNISKRKWYPVEYLRKIHRWIGEDKGEKYLRRAGNYTVQDLGILSYLVRFTSIERLLKKAPKSYDDAFSYGEVHIDIGEGEAIVKMKDVVIDEFTCAAWRGVFEGSLEATDTEGTVKPIDHEDKGGNDCFFKMSWN